MVSEDDEEEKLLKIHYQDSKGFIEIPLESNGKILSKDITCMDSRISALIIQKKDSKRMVKFKDGYVKEPKETWENVKVYAVLEENQEVKLNKVTSAENSYTDGTYNWNTRIKSETPAVLTEELLNNNQSGITRSLPSSSNVQSKLKVEAREMSTTVQHSNHPVSSSTIARNYDNSSQNESAAADDDGSDSDVEKSSSDDVVINSYHNVTDNWNTRIKLETPAVLTEEILNNIQPGVTRSMTSSSNSCSIQNKVNSEARAMSTAVQKRGYLFSDSDENDNSSEDKSYGADVGSNSNVDKSSYSKKAGFKAFRPDEKIIESVKNVTVIDESTKELLLAYKVSSLNELGAKLCRGDFKYVTAFRDAINRFNRTMVAYPNNEFVRLIYFAQKTKVMVKSLIPKTFCDSCNEDFTLKHLVSHKHANMYHRKFNADPPEVALLLNPNIYEKFIDPLVLKGLKIRDYKKMEELSNFSISGSNEALFKLKYILMNRIIQQNFAVNWFTGFSLKKLVFLQNNSNYSALQTIFTTDDFECRSCKKLRNNFPDYLVHILSDRHIKNSLNQQEFNNICKAMSLVKITPNGYCFLASEEVNRKRKQSSDNSQNGVKRQKMSLT